ncbi:DUF5688 family protein [Lacrimispora indolis]|uniref:DUF5688 family protein n=1 Tax=Lacrimispora indolis TaxID=69825 RepID=UPI00040BD900|nr:DUF5688 family protein [[Clostridium] methoxybenzovorans]
MNKETWMEKVREALCKRLGTGYQLEPESRGAEIVIRIEKDGDLTGIAVNLSVCEPAWLYCEEKIREVADTLEREYRRMYEFLHKDAISDENLENVRHMVVYVLEKRRGNEEVLSHIPYVEFFDTVLIFELHLHREVESFRRVINNEDLRQWGVGTQELLEAARKNTPIFYPPVIGLLESETEQNKGKQPEPVEISALFSKTTEDVSDRLFVLTSVNGLYGAGCIFYEGVLRQIAGACQDNLVIFPTSPYEVLLFPSQRNCWRTEEWLNIVSEMERARGYGDWSFLDAFYLYDRIEDTIKPIRKRRNQAETLIS